MPDTTGEYTPTTESVRSCWGGYASTREARLAQFDRYALDHDAAARAQGAAEERAKVVAELRRDAEAYTHPDDIAVVNTIRESIERGDHEATT